MKLPQNSLFNIACVGTIFKYDKKPDVKNIKDACDIVEIRLDGLTSHSDHQVLATFLKELAQSIPVILTARHPQEGGQNFLNVKARLELIKKYLEHANYLDLEIDFWEENGPLMELARASKVGIIGSTHDFAGPLNMDKLHRSVELGKAYEVTITKIATRLQRVEELSLLCDFMKVYRDRPLSIMGMGSLGPVSRLLFAQHGSLLNYGFLEEANAPGQLPVRLMREVLASLDQIE